MEKQIQMTRLLNNFFKKSAESFTAINVGNFYLKGLVVKEGKAVDYFLQRNEGLSPSIEKICKAGKIPTKTIKISLKDSSCLVRYFPFPKMEKKKLHQALFYQMSKLIPFSPEDVYFDFSLLKEINQSQEFILLAIAKKDCIDKILEAFAKHNIKVSQICLDSVCLTNLFLNNQGQHGKTNSCILDIGYGFSTITILEKEIPYLTRDTKFNAKEIVQIISRVKDLSEAEIEKQFLSTQDNNEFLELAKNSISGLCQEIKSSFDYFEMNRDKAVEKVYLTGGLASLKGIEPLFKEYLGVDTEILTAFSEQKKVEVEALGKEFDSFKNSFAATFGLIL